MQLHQVIRKYRKEKELTQEEMANALGITASAVNKWERGNALPDITLLGPIARLLGISLEELLSFRAELTPQEIQKLVKEGDKRFSEEDYEEAFAWAREQILQNPDCEPLIHSLALQMDTRRLTGNVEIREEQEAFILRCYERLVKSKEESMRMAGADALYGYYFRKGEYDKAREALSCFPSKTRSGSESWESYTRKPVSQKKLTRSMRKSSWRNTRFSPWYSRICFAWSWRKKTGKRQRIMERKRRSLPGFLRWGSTRLSVQIWSWPRGRRTGKKLWPAWKAC